MGNKAKEKNKERRRAAKKARKRANYLRTGPKAGQAGRRMKRSRINSFKPGKPREEPVPLIHKSAAGKRRAKSAAGNAVGHKNSHPNRPLRPLRKRLHLSSGDIGDMRGNR